MIVTRERAKTEKKSATRTNFPPASPPVRLQKHPRQRCYPERRLPILGALETTNEAPLTQSLEPFFIPKLQNSFADFPNLHYSISPEAVHLGDLMRLSVRLSPRIFTCLDFHGPSPAHRTSRRAGCSCNHLTPSPHNAIPGSSES